MLLLLLVPPLLWLGVIYLGSLFALLAQSFFYIDDFSGLTVYEPTLADLCRALHAPANIDIIMRTVVMAAVVTLICARDRLSRSPITWRAIAGVRAKAIFYLAVMLPLWSNYLVRVYAWKLILAKEGVITWSSSKLASGWLLDGMLALPVIGGPSLSVVLYRHLHRLRLYLAALHDPADGGGAGARAALAASRPRPISAPSPRETFRQVILPLAIPGVAAGSIFTFSLTLGDYIIPNLVGSLARPSSAWWSMPSRARPATSRWPPPSRSCRWW